MLLSQARGALRGLVLPTASVDSKTAGGLLELMQKLNEEQGVTFIFSTHDPAVMRRARRTVTLMDGVVVNGEAPTDRSELVGFLAEVDRGAKR